MKRNPDKEGYFPKINLKGLSLNMHIMQQGYNYADLF
jgi:hypothetical protein